MTNARLFDGDAAHARLVVGSAGTGKTTTLERYAIEALREGTEPVTYIARNRAAARRSRLAIAGEVGATDRFIATTAHAFALSLLTKGWRLAGYASEPALLSAPDQFARVRSMLQTPDEQQRWELFPRARALAGFAAELREVILRAEDADRAPAQLAEAAGFTGDPALVEAAAFYGRYLEDLRRAGEVDHGSAIRVAADLFEDSDDDDVERAEVRGRFIEQARRSATNLVIDDLQTLAPAMVRLLAAVANPSGRIAAAFDPDAPSFGFRGGAERPEDLFEKRFYPVERIELTERVRPTPTVRSHRTEHPTDERAAIVDEVRRAHGDLKLAYSDIAIVVRSLGGEASAIRRALERARIPVSIVGENRALGAEPVLAPLVDLVRYAFDEDSRADVLPRLLVGPLTGFDSYEVRQLQDEARRRKTDVAGIVADPPPELPELYRRGISAFEGLVRDLVERDAEAQRADAVWWWLWCGAQDDEGSIRFPHLVELVTSGENSALDAVEAFSASVTRASDRRPDERFSAFVLAMRAASFGAEPWSAPEERRPDSVRILTPFAALGREFDLVLVPVCLDGNFPLRRERVPLLDVRTLIAPTDPLTRRRERVIHEERVFGSILDRARQMVVLTCAQSNTDLPVEPSPLALARGYGFDDPLPDPPATVFSRDAYEALQRRRLADSGSSPEVKAEALGILARLRGVEPDDWWFEQDWTRTDTSIRAEGFRTSYTKLESYENCPLKYLYGSEAGLDQSQSQALFTGNWVHSVIEQATLQMMDGGAPPSHEDLCGWLADLWDPAAFDNAAVEHRRRIECEEMLERWIRADLAQPVVAVEAGFEFPEGEVTVRGFIDRIAKRNSGGSELIDYKTGRGYVSEDEVAGSLQLAIYTLAIERDPALTAYRPVASAVLAFLGQPRARSVYHRPRFAPPDGYVEESATRLTTIVEGIQVGRFAPSGEADCSFCPFKPLCPLWPQGEEVAL